MTAKKHREPWKTKFEKTLLAVSFIGVLLSAYAITLHYSNSESSICHIGPLFDCDKVNRSPWSELFGVPVAIFGLLAYLAVFYVVLFRHRIMRWTAFTHKDIALYLFIAATGMLGFQAYLTLIEMFVIKSYCLVCVGSQICTLLLGWFSWDEYSRAEDSYE